MTTTTPVVPSETTVKRTPTKRSRWLVEVAWKYPVAVVVVFIAAFPLVYVLSASFAKGGSLSGSSKLFSQFSLGQLPGTWRYQILDVGTQHSRGGICYRHRRHAHGSGGGLRVLALPLQRSPHLVDEPVDHPNVSPNGGVHRGVLAAAGARKRGARPRPQLQDCADLRVSWRRARRQHVPHVRILQLRANGDRRVRQG